MKIGNRTFFYCLAGITALAIFLGSWKICHPGLYYDETLFGNAAVGGKTDNFVTYRIKGIPIFLMNYIGALKAWIYYPLFKVLPVNYWTIRIPALLIGVAGGIFLVMALKRGFGTNTAILGSVMILLDPTLLTHARVDWGPNSLMFFFRGLLILGIVSWVMTGKGKWLWVSFIAMALGSFDKLNFIWVAAAASASLVLVYRNDLKKLAVDHPGWAMVIAGSTGFCLGIILTKAMMVAEHRDIGWGARLKEAYLLIRYTIFGGGALEFISGDGFRLQKWILAGYFLAGFLALAGLKHLLRDPASKKLYLWFVCTVLFLTAAFILTKTASGSHHSSMLSGMWQFLLVPPIGAFLAHSNFKYRISLAGLAIALVLFGNVYANILCVRYFAFPSNTNWDPANAQAALFPKEHPEANYTCTDWGVGTQSILLTKGRIDISDAWPLFSHEKDAIWYIRNMPRNRDNYFFTHLAEFENFKGNRANLSNALDSAHLGHEVVRSFQNWQGRPVIEIWKVPASGTRQQ